jgi:hypothetical protein
LLESFNCSRAAVLHSPGSFEYELLNDEERSIRIRSVTVAPASSTEFTPVLIR